MTILSKINDKFKTSWDEFIVKDQDALDTQFDIDNIRASEKLKLLALNMGRYSGYDGFGYDIGNASRGITEQEAFNIWNQDFQKRQRILIKQLSSFNIKTISQPVFDGLMLYYIINGNVLTVTSFEGQYELRDYIANKDWDTVASMIKRSNFNRKFCSTASSVIKLADYGKAKTRTWMRQNGIFEMRDKNEINALGVSELERARFAYYAETQKFLPNMPEGIKRDIIRQYDQTTVVENFTYSTTNVFTIADSPSMEPVEKLTVEVNGNVIQHYFDFTLLNNVITITKSLNAGDIVRFTTKI
jgi:hypothetical protein